MAKYKANYKFKGLAEKKTFKKGQVFEVTEKRAKEIENKLKKIKPDFKLTKVEEPKEKE